MLDARFKHRSVQSPAEPGSQSEKELSQCDLINADKRRGGVFHRVQVKDRLASLELHKHSRMGFLFQNPGVESIKCISSFSVKLK